MTSRRRSEQLASVASGLRPPRKVVFQGEDGTIVNWWPKTGTIQFQGQGDLVTIRKAVTGEFGSLDAVMAPSSESTASPQQIFIVHGHDTEARDQLELALRRLGLEPYVLMNESGEGKTLIEALEGKIGKDHSSDFGIALMTPDDMGYAKAEEPEKAEPRARQNVILETGMLLSSLTRARMAIMVKGHVELPSDLEGIIRFHYNDHVKESVGKFVQRLKEAGFDIAAAQLAAAAQ